MGSGASKGAKAKAGFEAPPGAAALRRRRRLLLGLGRPGPPAGPAFTAGAASDSDSRAFEEVAPWEQWQADLNDPVFDRARDGQDLRRSLGDVKDEGGYLRENAMELLQLNLRLPSKISRRLYHLARVQRNLGEPRSKPQLTCFEVLCLSSALRWSSEAELLELLFCFFDADGDDRVGEEDMVRSIDAFLSLEESSASFSDGEKKEFRKLDERRKFTEIRRIAKQALGDFASQDSEEEELPELPELEPETQQAKEGEKDESKDTTADEPDREGAAQKEGSVSGSVEHEASTSSKLAETGTKLEMPQPKKAAKRGGLCGRPPKEERSFGFQEEAPKPGGKEGEPPKAAETKAKAKAKAKAKPKKKPGGGGFCGPAKRPLTFSFRQWARWIITTEVLPPGMLEAAREASKPKSGLPAPASRPAESQAAQAVPELAKAKPSQSDPTQSQASQPSLALAIPVPPEPKSPARSDDTPDADDEPHKGTELSLSQPLLSAVS